MAGFGIGKRKAMALVVVLGLLGGPATTTLTRGGSVGAETSIDYQDGVVSVAAAYRVPVVIVDRVSKGSPVSVRCGFLDWVESAQTFIFLGRAQLPQANDPLIHCWRPATEPGEAGRALAGFPRRYRPRRPTTDDVVTAYEVTQVAAASVTLPRPTVALSPPAAQLVGVPTWLAVSDGLVSRSVSAQAGPVWATVRPVVRSVHWSMGNGDSVHCTRDLDRQWRPTDNRKSRSACSYTFTDDGGSGRLVGKVVVRWDLQYQNNETGGQWRRWRTVGRSSPVMFTVSELQAVVGG